MSRPHPLDQGCPPKWASGWGEDRFGIYVEFTVAGASQRMRWLEPGEFQMGSPENEPGRFDDEGPRHLETIEGGFWLADSPCTQAVWLGVMNANPSRFQSPNRPVERVTREDCEEFCHKLGDQIGDPGWRLPTESEWEYACRAGSREATYVGPLEIRGERNAPILDSIAWYGGNSGVGFELEEADDSSRWPEKQFEHARAGTHGVKKKAPNTWGLYDMLGNVFEWCSGEGEDSESDGFNGVIRGGSWFSYARYLRAAPRYRLKSRDNWSYLGFRLARSHGPNSDQ